MSVWYKILQNLQYISGQKKIHGLKKQKIVYKARSTANLDLSTAIKRCQKIRNTLSIAKLCDQPTHTHKHTHTHTLTVIHYCKVHPHHWPCVISRIHTGTMAAHSSSAEAPFTWEQKQIWILTWSDSAVYVFTLKKNKHIRTTNRSFCPDVNELDCMFTLILWFY